MILLLGQGILYLISENYEPPLFEQEELLTMSLFLYIKLSNNSTGIINFTTWVHVIIYKTSSILILNHCQSEYFM